MRLDAKGQNEVQFGRKSRVVGAARYQQLGYQVRDRFEARVQVSLVEMDGNDKQSREVGFDGRTPLTLIMNTAAVAWRWRSSERLLKD